MSAMLMGGRSLHSSVSVRVFADGPLRIHVDPASGVSTELTAFVHVGRKVACPAMFDTLAVARQFADGSVDRDEAVGHRQGD